MKKQIIIITFIFAILLNSGCVEQTNEKEIATINYVVSDVFTSRGVERKIEYVYVEVQNFEDEDIMITIDFNFALLDLDELGQGPYSGGTSGETSIWDDTYNIQRNVIVPSHDMERISYSPRSRSDNKIEYEWDYEITASFN